MRILFQRSVAFPFRFTWVLTIGLLFAFVAWAASGDLLWQDQSNLAGGTDGALAVAAEGGRVFTAGTATNAAGNSDFLVRAYDAQTGALRWEDQFDRAGGNDAAFAITAAAGQVFVAGSSTPAGGACDLSGGNCDFVIRAYDQQTGALRWEDQFDRGASNDQAFIVATEGGRVFVGGISTAAGNTCVIGTPGNCDFTVRAYSVQTGALLWQDQSDTAGGNDAVFSLAVQGNQVFAGGFTAPAGAICSWPFFAAGDCNLLIRAYDAPTGALSWQDQVDKAGNDDFGNALTATGERVFLAGWSTNAAGNHDIVVRAYHPRSGALLWEDQFDRAAGHDEAFAVVVQGGRVFAAGESTNSGGNYDLHVRAYDARTGAFLWENSIDKDGGQDGATSIAVHGGQLFSAGLATNTAGNSDLFVAAYHAQTGALLWENQFDRAGGSDSANGLAVAAQRVFAVGFGANGSGGHDWLVRAYDAR